MTTIPSENCHLNTSKMKLLTEVINIIIKQPDVTFKFVKYINYVNHDSSRLITFIKYSYVYNKVVFYKMF